MQNQLRRAADGLLALAAGLLTFTGSAAHAQSDPFALPPSTTSASVKAAAGPGPSEIEVDGTTRARLVDLQGHGNALTIDADGARVAGLPVPDGAKGQIPLASLQVYQWSFDTLRQRLTVKLFQKAEGRNFHDFARRDTGSAVRRTVPAIRLDYDVTAGFRPGTVAVGGLFGAAVIKGDLVAATAVQVTSASGRAPTRVTRLDSFARGVIPGTTTVATVGDFISKGSTTQRALRVGGIQIASDFSQQPNLVTQPLPGFKGSIAVPTSVDVLVADTQFKIGELEPGDFAIRNVPTDYGRGTMTVLMKDSLGRQVAQTVDFYNSATLLKPGLAAYAVNAGFVRRRYGDANADYGSLVASAYYRRGLSPFLTAEASAESTAGLVNFGVKGDFTLGNVALAAVELRGSTDSRVGQGGMLNASLESIGKRTSFRTGVSLPTSKYRDVASHLGDRPPAEQLFANLSFRLTPKLPIQLSYVRQKMAASDFQPSQRATRNETLALSASYAPDPRTYFNLNAGLQDQGRRSFFVVAGINFKLGSRHSVSGGFSSGAGRSLAAAGYRFDDIRNSGVRAQAAIETLNGATRTTGEATYQADWGAVQGSVVMARGSVAGQASASGSVVLAGGEMHALQNSNTSYLLVRSDGVEGIPVMVDNRYVGKTNARGKLFVRNLIPHAEQRVDIDGDKLPHEAIVTAGRHLVSIPAQAVGVLDIAAMYYRPMVLQLVDEQGRPLAAGLRAFALPSNRETQVGYDGLLEFNAAGTDKSVRIEATEGDCIVDVPQSQAEQASLVALVCRRAPQFVQAEDTAKAASKGKLAGKKVARRN